MNINLNNYEAYFLDYHEGSLSPALVDELLQFVANHPELKEELEGFENITLDVPQISHKEKSALKKSLAVTPENFDELAVQFMEGKLPELMQKELLNFIKHYSVYQHELDLYIKTKLVPDNSIVFEDKYLLKRSEKRPVTWLYWSAAASVALIIGAYFLINRSANLHSNTLTNLNKTKDSNVIVKQTPKAKDTSNTNAIIAPNVPVKMSNNALLFAVKIPNKRAHENKILPVETIHFVLSDSGDNSFVSVMNLQDTNSIHDWKKKITFDNNPDNDLVNADVQPEKKRNKFLYQVAKLTCKGLHALTGQPIKMEKRYDADTVKLVAYQLDLGNKKFDFPVKE